MFPNIIGGAIDLDNLAGPFDQANAFAAVEMFFWNTTLSGRAYLRVTS